MTASVSEELSSRLNPEHCTLSVNMQRETSAMPHCLSPPHQDSMEVMPHPVSSIPTFTVTADRDATEPGYAFIAASFPVRDEVIAFESPVANAQIPKHGVV